MTIEPIIVEPISTIRTNTTTQPLVNNKITVAPTTSPSSTTSNTTTTSTSSTSSNSSFAIKPQRSNKKFFNLIFAVDPVQIESSGP
jgi:hypothetical protein